jgi:very-short-patch-repair endonuclease
MLPYNGNLKQLSRQLRENMTDAEKRLWAKIRMKQLNGYQFYRQKPIGDYIVDFYCPRAKLVSEVDGGQHSTDEVTEYDRIKDVYLSSLGLRVLRFPNTEVLKRVEGVVESIEEEISKKIPLSPPFSKGETATSPFGKGRARGI